MGKPVAPCKGCTERFVGCHSQCEKYKQFTQENDKMRKHIQDQYYYEDYAIKKSVNLGKYRKQHKM